MNKLIKILLTTVILCSCCSSFAQDIKDIEISPKINTASKNAGYLGKFEYKNTQYSIGTFLYAVKTGKLTIKDGMRHVFYYRYACDHRFKVIQVLEKYVLYSCDVSLQEDPDSDETTDETFTFLLEKRNGNNYITDQQLNRSDGLYYALIDIVTYQTALGSTNTVLLFKCVDDELKDELKFDERKKALGKEHIINAFKKRQN